MTQILLCTSYMGYHNMWWWTIVMQLTLVDRGGRRRTPTHPWNGAHLDRLLDFAHGVPYGNDRHSQTSAYMGKISWGCSFTFNATPNLNLQRKLICWSSVILVFIKSIFYSWKVGSCGFQVTHHTFIQDQQIIRISPNLFICFTLTSSCYLIKASRVFGFMRAFGCSGVWTVHTWHAPGIYDRS